MQQIIASVSQYKQKPENKYKQLESRTLSQSVKRSVTRMACWQDPIICILKCRNDKNSEYFEQSASDHSVRRHC